MTREIKTHRFIRALQIAFENTAIGGRSIGVVDQAFRNFQQSPLCIPGVRQFLPACAYLSSALTAASRVLGLWEITESFRGIASDLDWYHSRSQCYAQTASSNFFEGHANATIIGPGGLVTSEHLRVGVSLLAPDVRHPDHSHKPAVIYLAVSEGEFRLGAGDWSAPGYRGTLFNESNAIFAMRSGCMPLLAFWILDHNL